LTAPELPPKAPRGSDAGIILSAALAALVLFSPLRAADDDASTREAMRAIFDAVRVLLDASMEEDGFSKPGDERRILKSLRELDDQAVMLLAHGFPESTGATFLASALERYSSLMLRTYEWGYPERAEALLYQTTEICVACHTRLPSPGDSPVAEQFVASEELSRLPALEQAQLQVATRRFDDALATLERFFADDPGAVDELFSALRTYLIVSIRVKKDFLRPVSTLEQIAAGEGLDPALRADLKRWIEALYRLQRHRPRGEGLEAARELIRQASGPEYPTSRSALVHYVTASSLLHRYTRDDGAASSDKAEAHYLLGVAEYRMAGDDWLPQAELYLEFAIVSAPDAPWAKQAYMLLEEKVEMAYITYPGEELPPEIAERLAELRRMVMGI